MGGAVRGSSRGVGVAGPRDSPALRPAPGRRGPQRRRFLTRGGRCPFPIWSHGSRSVPGRGQALAGRGILLGSLSPDAGPRSHLPACSCDPSVESRFFSFVPLPAEAGPSPASATCPPSVLPQPGGCGCVPRRSRGPAVGSPWTGGASAWSGHPGFPGLWAQFPLGF